jgi:CheY-like chemotaxis protein
VNVHEPVVEFTVADSGRGIEQEALDRIFDMFEQARAVGEPSAGLGLGLHLARAFAELHGGSARARSEGLGKGSEFTLSLPIVAAGTPGAARAPGVSAPLPQSVLVVDDNLDAAHTLQALLSMQGVSAAVAHDGAQAVEYVRAKRPQAIVMDIGMPVMNGYEAARRIREIAPAGEIVLIALTGWGQYSDKARAAEAGFDFHFVKPLQIDELMACLTTSGQAQAA